MFRKLKCLSGNGLKILAMVFMTLDHVGLMLFPRIMWLRIIGRLAMPVFAYMIAEGCTYTKNRKKYLLTVAAFAVVCQLVYLFFMHLVYQCILVTFTLSISLIFLLDRAGTKGTILSWLTFGAALIGVFILCNLVPGWIPGFRIDYGLWGVLLPVMIYCGKTGNQRILLTVCGLVLLSGFSGGIQWYCLLSVPLLLLYNGKRGKWKLKYLFYVYFPLHLAALAGISMLLS